MRAEADGRTAPPLLAWAAGAALPVAAVLALMASPYYPERQTSKAIADATRKAVAPAAAQDMRVVALGSSLLLLATPAGARGAGWQWTQIPKLRAGLGHLDASLAVMEDAPPDVLVVEKNLFLPDRDIPLMQKLRINIGAMLKQATSTPDSGYDPPPAVLAKQLKARHCLHLQPPKGDEVERHQRALAKLYRGDLNAALAARLRRLAERGVRVVILDVPRSAAVENGTAAEKSQWQARLRTILPPGRNLSYHSGPSYPESSLYCDANHLNTAGAELFQQWWWPRLQKMQKAQS